MKKKCFIIFLLFAFINYLMGCYSTNKASKEEVFTSSEKIAEAVLVNGDVIRFNESGGNYVQYESVIIGNSEEGKFTSLPIENISEFRVTKPSAVHLEEIQNKIITEVVNKNNRLIKFDKTGARFDAEKSLIVGTTIKNDSVSINIKDALAIYTDRAETLDIEQLKQNKNLMISQAVLKNSNILITFDENGATYFANKSLVTGLTDNKKLVNIDQSDILYVKVQRINAPATILASIGIVAGILTVAFLIALATKQSCPFVYSHNSEIYVFDAEPLGGAVSKGLQRTDLSKLDHLKEVDGKYKLLVRNEVPETQHIDEMSLFVIDHPEGTQVISDLKGNLFTVTKPQKIISAVDENEKDITKFVSHTDYNFWQTKLPVTNLNSQSILKHQLTFVFPKPAEKKKAKLIINAGTALWGSQMIREMLSMYGDEIDNWYEKVDNMSGSEVEKEQMMQFVVREELYYLNILVNEKNGWNSQGLIFGGGPLIAETKVYDLNLENVEGDSLVIRLNPPYGFWTLDYISVEYEENYKPSVKEIKLSKAVDHTNNDVLEAINSFDDKYYSMPEVGDYFLAEFDAVPQTGETDRSYFLKTSGYYELHLDKDKPMQKELLYEIVNKPGKVVEYAMKLYNQWIYSAKF